MAQKYASIQNEFVSINRESLSYGTETQYSHDMLLDKKFTVHAGYRLDFDDRRYRIVLSSMEPNRFPETFFWETNFQPKMKFDSNTVLILNLLDSNAQCN